DADRIVRIEERHQGSSVYPNVTYASFLDLARENTAFEHVAAARFWTTTLTEGDEPESVPSMVVSADYFRVLGVTPILGRDFLPEDDVQGNDNVVILGHALWQRRFGGDPTLVGKSIRAAGKSVIVVGILPPGYDSMYPFTGNAELWSPLVPGGSLRNNRRSHLLGTIARVKRGLSIEQAAAELANIARGINEQNPGVDDPDLALIATRLSERVAQPMRQALIVFLAAVGLLLLIACANVANLMLARAAGREREMAIRTALGAGRLRLARQLFTESALLAFAGGAAGLALAYWATKLVSTLNTATFPRINEVNVDARVLGFALLVSLLTGVLFGMAPVLQLPANSISGTLKEGGRGVAGPGRGWLRKSLIVSEVALALVLLIGAGLLINSFVRLMQTNRGFEPAGVLTINMILPASRYPDGTRQAAMLEQVVERVSAAPGVTSVGLTSTLPFTGGPATTFIVEDREPPEFGQEPSADIRIVDENYFYTLGIPIKGGRSFSRLDAAAAPRVMIINEEMAR
ncbi:MAG TPA: ABC transporter permease, partial [Blastocatellia bacterium]|nr:ABC transporter permease [Blastocatellia bacterium]